MTEFVSQKAQNYFFLSRWFAGKTTRPDLEQYLELIREIAPGEGELLDHFSILIKDWLTEDNIELELPREYTRLFHLPGGVKPYESVYRGEEIRLMQEPWVEVKSFYKKKGWQMENSIYPEDHAAVELSFMGHLIAAGEEQDAKDFFARHISGWLPVLMQDIIDHQQANYYKKVAEYGLSYLEAEENLYQAEQTN